MIPLATTTVRITRPLGSGDAYEETDHRFVADGVPAHVSSPAGTAAIVGGRQEQVDATLYIGTTPELEHTWRVHDERTGECWDLVWVRRRTGLGLDHQTAGLRMVKAAANA